MEILKICYKYLYRIYIFFINKRVHEDDYEDDDDSGNVIIDYCYGLTEIDR